MNPSYITSYLPFSPGTAAGVAGGGLAILGPVMFYAPSRYRWWILGGVLLIIGLVFLIRMIYGWFVGRKARASERELDREQQEAEDRASSVEERQKVREIREKFKIALQQLRDAKIPLYDLPWMMLIGEPQGGKTLTLRGSGLSFPVGYDAISGLGGTKNCDWFFANEAVFLDTAGRWTFSQEGASDSREWQTFLGDLVKKRRHCPINGCVVVIPVDALWRSPEKRAEEASNIYNKLGELQRTLKVRFPVFIMITKCDKLLGFTEFFQDFGDLPAQQIFGHSRAVSDGFDTPYDEDAFNAWFGDIMHRMSDRRTQILRTLQGMDDKATLDRRGRAFELPENFRAIGPALKGYLANIFARDRYHEPLFFRGVYFSSGIQTGTVSSAAMREILTGLGSDAPDVDQAQALPDSRPFFLQDFYQRKVLKETGMVFRSGKEIKQARRRTLVTYIGGAILALGLAGLLYFGQGKVAQTFADPNTVVTNAMQKWNDAERKRLPVKEARKNVTALSNAHDTLADPGIWFRILFPFARTSKPSTDVETVQNAIFGQSLLAPQVAEVIDKLEKPPAENETPLNIDVRADAFREVVAWYASNDPWREPTFARDDDSGDDETASTKDPNAEPDDKAADADEEAQEADVDSDDARWQAQARRLFAPLASDPNQDVLKQAGIDAEWFRSFLAQSDKTLQKYYGMDDARRFPVIGRRVARESNSRMESMIHELRDAYREAYLTPNEDSEFGRWRAVFNAIRELNEAMSAANGLSTTFEGVRTVAQYDTAIATWEREYARIEAAYDRLNKASEALRGPLGRTKTPKIPEAKRIQQSWSGLFQDCSGLVDAAPDEHYRDGKAEKDRVIAWLETAQETLDKEAVQLVESLRSDIERYKPYWTNENGINPDVNDAYKGFVALDGWLHQERSPGITVEPLTALGDWAARLSGQVLSPPELAPPPRTPGDLGSLKPLVDNASLMLTRRQRYLDVTSALKAIEAAQTLPGFYDNAQDESKTISYPGMKRLDERRFLQRVGEDLCAILQRLETTEALQTDAVNHVADLNRELLSQWRAYVGNFMGNWQTAYAQGEQEGVQRLLQTSTWPQLQQLMQSREPAFDLAAEVKRRHDALASNLSLAQPEPLTSVATACEPLNTIYMDELNSDAYQDLAAFKDGNVRFATTYTVDFEPLELVLRSPNPQLSVFRNAYAKLQTVPGWAPKTLHDLKAVADHANNLSSENLYSELAKIVAPYASSFPFRLGGELSTDQFRKFSYDLIKFRQDNLDLIESQRDVREYLKKCTDWIVFVYGKDALKATHPDDLEAKDAVFGVEFGNNLRNLAQTHADVTIGLKRGVGADPQADQPYTTKRIGIQGMGGSAQKTHYWRIGATSEFQVVIYRDVNNQRTGEATYPKNGALRGTWMVPRVIFELASDVRGRALKPTQAAFDVPFPGSDGNQGVVTFILSFDVDSPPLPRELIGRPPTR